MNRYSILKIFSLHLIFALNAFTQDPQKTFWTHGDPTGAEQLMLELINEARKDPLKEAERLDIDLNEDLEPGTISALPKAPIAMNQILLGSARAHSDWMLVENRFSHTGAFASNPHQRMEVSGYVFEGSAGSGENISFSGSTGDIEPDEHIRTIHDDLFISAVHRVNICSELFEDIGVGGELGRFTSNDLEVNALMVTQKFAFSSSSPVVEGGSVYILGVVYDDLNENGFYDPDEGIPGVFIDTPDSSFLTQTSNSGGYALPIPSSVSATTLRLIGGPFDEFRIETGRIGNQNIKLDVILGAPSGSTGGFAVWIAEFSELTGEEQLPNADPDADGVQNLMEYALGGKPDDASSAPGLIWTSTGDSIALSLSRPTGLEDIDLIVESGTQTRGPWSTVAVSQASGILHPTDGSDFITAESEADGFHQAEFSYIGDAEPVKGLFVRIQVTMK